MPETSSKTANPKNGLNAIGFAHLFRMLGIAIQPTKLIIALIGLWGTVFYGGCILDPICQFAGGDRFAPDAIEQLMIADNTGTVYEAPPGENGIFRVFKQHEQRAVLGLISSSASGQSVAAGTPVGALLESNASRGPLRSFVAMGYGVWWLIRYHFVYSFFLALGAMLIWSLASGMICRIAAVQFARDEKITLSQAFSFAKHRLIGGFFLAPCIPLGFMMVVAILLLLYGVLLRIPLLGDVLGGLGFAVALVGGFVIALLMVGLLVGGSLFWPAVATEGSDAFDAFSRGMSYPLSRPWKAGFYALASLVFAVVCWVLVNLFTYLGLFIARGLMVMGTSPFGWWNRGTEDAPISKLALMWPMTGPGSMYDWPDWSQLSWYEHFSAGLIGLSVMTVTGLMWAFLASLYHSGSTVIYFLLRRDVDGTDLEDLYVDEGEWDVGSPRSPDAVSHAAASATGADH
jgi:hypothetical protein